MADRLWSTTRPTPATLFLHATASATPADAHRVSEASARYAQNDSNFACSRPSDVNRQRMLAACGTFATEYGLAFTP